MRTIIEFLQKKKGDGYPKNNINFLTKEQVCGIYDNPAQYQDINYDIYQRQVGVNPKRFLDTDPYILTDLFNHVIAVINKCINRFNIDILDLYIKFYHVGYPAITISKNTKSTNHINIIFDKGNFYILNSGHRTNIKVSKEDTTINNEYIEEFYN